MTVSCNDTSAGVSPVNTGVRKHRVCSRPSRWQTRPESFLPVQRAGVFIVLEMHSYLSPQEVF